MMSPRATGRAAAAADPIGEGALGDVSWFRPRGWLDVTFEVSILLKGLDGVLELIGGLLLLFVTPEDLNRFVVRLTQHELSQDPNDYFANRLLHFGSTLTPSTVRFAALYLLLHGIVKVVLVVALLRNKLWAYPWLIAFLIAFIVYQLYRIALMPSTWLVLLTIFDVFVVALTWREWRKQRVGARMA
jgi:uncharacterized membrane protein